jgi:transposase
MARHPDAGKQQRWLDLMRRWHESELTVRAFCERHRLSEPSFYVWRRVLRERGLLQDRPAVQPSKPASPAFVKLTVDTERVAVSAVELVLSDRRLLRVRPGFDAATLLELVRLLEEPAC